ncbi:MAG TPA: hypothetical protein VN030_00730, partial [Cellvibrio sp.]|nr:hypothetical protein [Cellvibrio sp.]
MKYKYLLIIFALSLCANANADWFLRGTHNAWAAAPMEFLDANRVQLKGVVFSSAGNIKFDRFGDWTENYGVNGLSGNNIPVASGTWDIQFFTDTKKWTITASQSLTYYHVRGTFNAWIEGTLMSRIGTTDNYESCINFVGSDANGSPRFKIDPNGAWGDALPAADFVVAVGWVKINFNSISKAISVQQNLAPNCETTVTSSSKTISSAAVSSSSPKAISSSLGKSSLPSSSIASSLASSNGVTETYYHIRGTFNIWLEGTLMTRIGTSDNYERCVNFTGGDSDGGPRFKIDPNGGWGDVLPVTGDVAVSTGWVKITFNSSTTAISVQQNLSANCAAAVSSASSSVAAGTPYHVRGTFNAWQEGTLLNRIGTSDNYERCILFSSGVNLGIPRFKIDPNGAWGDALPTSDFLVSAGWVKVSFNSSSKMINVQQNLSANCAPVSSTAASSSLSSAAAGSSIATSTPY